MSFEVAGPGSRIPGPGRPRRGGAGVDSASGMEIMLRPLAAFHKRSPPAEAVVSTVLPSSLNSTWVTAAA